MLSTLLGRKLDERKERILREGRQAGLAEGRQTGLAEGRETGLAEGRQAGRLAERAEWDAWLERDACGAVRRRGVHGAAALAPRRRRERLRSIERRVAASQSLTEGGRSVKTRRIETAKSYGAAPMLYYNACRKALPATNSGGYVICNWGAPRRGSLKGAGLIERDRRRDVDTPEDH